MRYRAAAAVVALVVLASVAFAAAASGAGWSTAARLAGPVSLDTTPIQVAFASGGQAAVAFGFVDPDAPAGARASLAVLSASGRPQRVRAVPHTRQVLDLAYLGGAPQLLGATSGGGLACCTEVQTLTLGAHGFSAPRPLIRKLSGGMLARLLASGGGSLAVFGSAGGLWESRAASGERYGALHQLSASGSAPQSLVAEVQHGGGPLLAFTQAPIASGNTPRAPSIMISSSARVGLAPRARIAQTFPAGTAIGPLALAPNPSAPTLGWTEDVAQAGGANDSSVVLAAVGSTLRTRAYTVPGEIESGLAGAADDGGDELFAWESCDELPTCQVIAVSRPPRGHFGSEAALGTIDAAAEPAVAVGTHGAAAIAWVRGGHIYVARRGSGSQRFSAARLLAGPGPASNLRLAAGPGGRLLAVWSAGTTRATVWASEFR